MTRVNQIQFSSYFTEPIKKYRFETSWTFMDWYAYEKKTEYSGRVINDYENHEHI